MIKKSKLNPTQMELQHREIEVLKKCCHPNIIKMVDLFEDHKFFFIVLEYMEGGDLFDYLDRRDFVITEARAKEIARQLVSAVEYLHSYGIVHRDLKLENIMMETDSETATPRICDFGLSKMIGPEDTACEPFGTVAYAAPEVLQGKSYDKRVDVWSLGVIFHVLCGGSLPFDSEDNSEIAKKVL